MKTLYLMLGLLIAGGTVTLGDPLAVMATTSFVGDVVWAVGGDQIDLQLLVPLGADPHAFEPSPSDMVRAGRAEVVFAVSRDLEERLAPSLEAVDARVVYLADRVPLRRFDEGHVHHDHDHHHDGDHHQHDSDHGHHHDHHHHGVYDPHVWLDPTLVSLWTHAIEAELSALDPDNASQYALRAATYREELAQLDWWIAQEIQRVPEDRRLLVADHHVLGYFAARYALRASDTVFPGLSTLAEPSAAELSRLVERIRALDVPAVFVSTTVNPALSNVVAKEAGVHVVRVYTGSLSMSDGPAPTYIALMRHLTAEVVRALGG